MILFYLNKILKEFSLNITNVISSEDISTGCFILLFFLLMNFLIIFFFLIRTKSQILNLKIIKKQSFNIGLLLFKLNFEVDINGNYYYNIPETPNHKFMNYLYDSSLVYTIEEQKYIKYILITLIIVNVLGSREDNPLQLPFLVPLRLPFGNNNNGNSNNQNDNYDSDSDENINDSDSGENINDNI